MEFIKMAVVYELKENIFIQGYSVTTMDVNRLSGPVFTVKKTDKLAVLGQAVINALNECKTGVYHETREEYDQKKSNMIIATGMKTWKALDKSSRSFVVEALTDDQITFTPMRFLGAKGHNWVDGKDVTSDLNPEHLGRALLEALASSENPYLKESK